MGELEGETANDEKIAHAERHDLQFLSRPQTPTVKVH